jgi:hypothetical protein
MVDRIMVAVDIIEAVMRIECMNILTKSRKAQIVIAKVETAIAMEIQSKECMKVLIDLCMEYVCS